MANSKANGGGSAARTLSTPAQPFAMGQKVKYKPLYYLAAFLIPFLLTLVAYINFDVYPFGERSVLTLDLSLREAVDRADTVPHAGGQNGLDGVVHRAPEHVTDHALIT